MGAEDGVEEDLILFKQSISTLRRELARLSLVTPPGVGRFRRALATCLGVSVTLSLAACSSDATPDCTLDPPLSYDNFGHGYMEKNCTGCHSSQLPEGQRNEAPVGIDFDTYAGVIQWVNLIEDDATGDAPSMPPGGGPSAEDREMLSAWLNCQVKQDAEALAAQQGAP